MPGSKETPQPGNSQDSGFSGRGESLMNAVELNLLRRAFYNIAINIDLKESHTF